MRGWNSQDNGRMCFSGPHLSRSGYGSGGRCSGVGSLGIIAVSKGKPEPCKASQKSTGLL